jgi:hypothetical protein
MTPRLLESLCHRRIASKGLKAISRTLIGIGLFSAIFASPSCSSTKAGPYGGDVVPLPNSPVKAEVVANADTGEVMVHTWDQNLKTSQPIEDKPIIIGSGGRRVELRPDPTAGDPRGLCSRFYGQADWLRGGGVHDGWLGTGADQSHQEFALNNCWRGGQAHGSMWREMGDRRRGMMGHGPGAGMGHQ